jgi:hypothetical protein
MKFLLGKLPYLEDAEIAGSGESERDIACAGQSFSANL